MLETLWQIEIVRDIVYSSLVLLSIWVVIRVGRGGTQTIYQSNGERKAINYMVKHVQDNDGKVMKHIKETSGQTWEVKTPDRETSHYCTINTEDADETV